jgi:hypothetical protein
MGAKPCVDLQNYGSSILSTTDIIVQRADQIQCAHRIHRDCSHIGRMSTGDDQGVAARSR